jgi:hypothetical protein
VPLHSDDQKFCIRDGATYGSKRRELHRRRCAHTIRIIEQSTRAGIEDDPIIHFRGRCTSFEGARGQSALCSEHREHGIILKDGVIGNAVAMNLVDIACAERGIEDELMLARASHEQVVTTFDPILIAKYQRRFPDFDDKIISMYARGMTVREIRGHLEELYGIDVSPDLISTVTDAVLEAVTEWQGRPLDACYPLVFFDAIRVKIRDEGFVRNKAVYIALGIFLDITKEFLGLWIEQTEGAKFWMRVMNKLRNRGVADILIAVVDGLKGFPGAINAVFPKTIRGVYRAESAEAGAEAFDWGRKYPAIAQTWRRHWDR